MDRQFIADHLPLFKQSFQSVFQISFFRNDRKVVTADTTAVDLAKSLLEQISKLLQHFIALSKTVFRIVETHALEIAIQHHRLLPVFPDLRLHFICQIKEIVHIRQTGQQIKLTVYRVAQFMKCIAESPADIADIQVQLIDISSFIGIPDLGKSRSVFSEDMFTAGMDDLIAAVIFRFCPVDDFILAAFGRKMQCCIGDPGHIIRMSILVHIIVHIINCFFTIFIAKQFQEAI